MTPSHEDRAAEVAKRIRASMAGGTDSRLGRDLERHIAEEFLDVEKQAVHDYRGE